MMPKDCVGLMLFPYTADIYYATHTQDAWGAMQPAWEFDRTIKCQIVNVYEDSSNDRPMLLENQNRFMMWDESYVLRSEENVLFDGTEYHTPNTTLVTNIQTADGMKFWLSTDGEETKFEVRGMMPILDPFGKLHHYKVTISASNDQELE